MGKKRSEAKVKPEEDGKCPGLAGGCEFDRIHSFDPQSRQASDVQRVRCCSMHAAVVERELARYKA